MCTDKDKDDRLWKIFAMSKLTKSIGTPDYQQEKDRDSIFKSRHKIWTGNL